jgi:hypothetical protein
MLVGAAVGILALLVVGRAGSFDDLGQLIGSLIGLVILTVLLAAGGLWIGAAVGVFLLLRALGFKDPWRTALAAALLLPFWGFAVVLLGTGIGQALNDAPGIVSFLLVVLGAATIIAVPALAGRAYARLRQEGHL